MRNNIHKFIKETINPRLTTQEMESSQTRCGCDHQIAAIHYGDHKSNFPTNAIGSINSGMGWIMGAMWNRYGECTVARQRIKSFDLITQHQKEINEAKPVFLLVIVFLLFTIILILT